MPNTKAVGVAYADPQFDSVTVTGTSALGSVTATSVAATGAVSGATVAASGAVTGASFTARGTAAVANGTAGLYFLTTAVTANSTTTDAPAGSIGVTTNATGLGELFISDGTKWQFAVVA